MLRKKGAYNGAWIKLDNMDLKEYDELVFWAKGDADEGFTTVFKIEIKSPKGRGEYIVGDVTNSWKEVTVPLTGFKTSSGDSRISCVFTIVFEDWRATDKKGAVYVDDIYFTPSAQKPTLTPTPSPTSTPKPTPAPTIIQSSPKEEPGFESVFAITGLLAVAYLLKREE